MTPHLYMAEVRSIRPYVAEVSTWDQAMTLARLVGRHYGRRIRIHRRVYDGTAVWRVEEVAA